VSRRAWRGLAALLAAGGLLALHVGWRRRARPWPVATGWARIPAAPAPRSSFALGAERVTLAWLGHSGFLVEWRGVRLLLDPHLSDRVTISPRLMERSIAPADLGAIDAALVSHAHRDHLDSATLAAVPEIRALLVPRGSEGYVTPLPANVGRVVPLAPGEITSVGPLAITAVVAFHHGNRDHPLASAKIAVGWVIRGGGRAIYFAGDTGRRAPFAEIGARHHPDLAILPIGSFAPAWPIGRVHLSPEQAVEAARAHGVAFVVPCHFGTFTLSLDREDEALPRFAAAAGAAGLDWAMPDLLRPAHLAVPGAP
jgi:L-ascorbate metabolism protein UlaG (beta-lactamase superfamily)